jgi:hypothetical protein
MQMQTARDGVRVYDINLKDFGVKLYQGKIRLGMQLWDYTVKSVYSHSYIVTADLQFLGQKLPDIDWPPIVAQDKT